MAERKKTPLTIEEMIDDSTRRDFIGRFIEQYKFDFEKGHVKPVGILGLYAVLGDKSTRAQLIAVYDPESTDNFTVQTIVDGVKQRAVRVLEERVQIGYVMPMRKEDFEMIEQMRETAAVKLN